MQRSDNDNDTPAQMISPASATIGHAELPTLFVSHGAPTFALEPGDAGQALLGLAARMETPRAILVLSPHWIRATTALTTHAQPETIHDFGGFPAPLYRLRYPAAGAPEVARRAQTLLAGSGIEVELDATRGLDHGAWVPLLHMYPKADIPVVQLAMPYGITARGMFVLGRALAPLRQDGVLIVGSGSLTHNLYEFRGEDGPAEPYVLEFAEWIAARLQAGDEEALLDYRRRAPHAERAHPTDEHLLPLMFALGAAGPAPTIQRFAASDVRYRMLAMDTYRFAASN